MSRTKFNPKTTIRIGAAHWDITVGSWFHEDIAASLYGLPNWGPGSRHSRLTTLAAFICHTHGITEKHAPTSRVNSHPPRVHKRPTKRSAPAAGSRIDWGAAVL